MVPRPQAAPQTPLAQISRAQREAVLRRIVGKTQPVVAPLDVAAFSSSI